MILEAEQPKPSPQRHARRSRRWLWLSLALVFILLGAVAGVGLAWFLANVMHYNPKPDFFPIFYLPRESMLAGVGLAAATGFLSGIVPAIAGMRLKATEALRSV